MKKLTQIMFVAMFLGVLYVTPIVTLLDERETISSVENRKLAEVPVYTRDSFLDGSYLNKWETYFSDHIKGRNVMIEGYTTINMKALGKTNVNNIILGKKITCSPSSIIMPSTIPASAMPTTARWPISLKPCRIK